MDFALPHRMRRMPFESPQLNRNDLEKSMSDSQNKKDQDKDNTENNPQKNNQQQPKQDSGSRQSDKMDEETSEVPKESVFDMGKPIDTKRIEREKKDRMHRKKLRGKSVSSVGSKGKYVSSKIPKGKPKDIALDATIRAAAPYQKKRKNNGNAITIKSQDIRGKVRVGKISNACVFVVDASGSMGAMKRMESAKGAVLSLLMESYQQRDRVSMISFRGDRADVLLPLCSSVDLAVDRLRELPTGGRTPLSAGLMKGINLLIAEKKKNKEIMAMLLLISDGHANVPLNGEGDIKKEIMGFTEQIRENDIHTVVIDTETAGKSPINLQLGYCRDIALHSDGRYYPIEDLTAEKIHGIATLERELSMNPR